MSNFRDLTFSPWEKLRERAFSQGETHSRTRFKKIFEPRSRSVSVRRRREEHVRAASPTGEEKLRAYCNTPLRFTLKGLAIPDFMTNCKLISGGTSLYNWILTILWSVYVGNLYYNVTQEIVKKRCYAQFNQGIAV